VIVVATMGPTVFDPGAKELVEAADRALHVAKERGRNSVVHADELVDRGLL
jgi:PleD family two-component response regulator